MELSISIRLTENNNSRRLTKNGQRNRRKDKSNFSVFRRKKFQIEENENSTKYLRRLNYYEDE